LLNILVKFSIIFTILWWIESRKTAFIWNRNHCLYFLFYAI